MRTTVLMATSLCALAACAGDDGPRRLEIEPLGVSIRVPSTHHDVDLVHERETLGGDGELRRVDITIPGLRLCRISLFPKAEELSFDDRVRAAELQLFGTERVLTRWHTKEETAGGWELDYEVVENGRSMRVVSQRREVGGRPFTCESGRIVGDDEAARCAEIVAAACRSLAEVRS